MRRATGIRRIQRHFQCRSDEIIKTAAPLPPLSACGSEFPLSSIHFLLSVPADEGSLAHRRHVLFRVIELDSLTDRLDLEKIFGRKAPVHIDLGCGDGSFLCELAQRMPQKNFLGIERLLNRIRASARRASALDNVRLLRIESSYAVRYLLPVGSIEKFYLLFPDPWPKRRHHPRRIMRPDFLNAVHTALQEAGSIYIATDDSDYFRSINEIAQSHRRFAISETAGDLPLSRFGRLFQQKGAAIHSLELRKISPVK